MAGALSQRVMKAMGILGGVQMVNILCSIVRTKVVALWIGTAGVGLFGLFNSAVDLISTIAQMGLRTSGTRDIAASPHDSGHRDATVQIVRRLAWVLGLAGAALMLLGAPLLSRLSFADTAHTWAFRLLAPAVLFLSVGGGETAVLQGVGRLKAVAHAGLCGAIGSAVSAIPLIWYFGIDGIVPVIVTGAACMMAGALSWRYKIAEPVKMAWRTMLPGVRSLLRLGFFITASDIITFLASYTLISYLNVSHGTSTAGLYQSGFTMINRYVGLVFAAITIEYYPRLASVCTRSRISEVFVNHEIRIMLLTLIPLMSIFVVVSPWIVMLLYSSAFEPMLPFIEIGTLGTMLRAVSWCIAMMMLARGDGSIYLLTETLSAAAYIALNILTINTLGIAGMGYAYAAWYGVYLLIVGIVFYRRYGMRLNRGIALLAVLAVASLSAVIAATFYARALGAVVAAAVVAAVGIRIVVRRRGGAHPSAGTGN